MIFYYLAILPSNVNFVFRIGQYVLVITPLRGMLPIYRPDTRGRLDSVEWNGGMERWNGLL